MVFCRHWKTISTKEADNILKLEHEKKHKHDEKISTSQEDKIKLKKSKKPNKLQPNKKKIRKK